MSGPTLPPARALFGVLTANVAAFFVEQDQQSDPLTAKVDEVLRRLDLLEERLGGR